MIQILLLAAMLSTPPGAGPQPQAVQQNQASKPLQYEGEIQSYEPGKLLTVRKARMVEVKYDLTKDDTAYTIDPGVRKGSKVNVTEEDADGRHRVTVRLKQ